MESLCQPKRGNRASVAKLKQNILQRTEPWGQLCCPGRTALLHSLTQQTVPEALPQSYSHSCKSPNGTLPIARRFFYSSAPSFLGGYLFRKPSAWFRRERRNSPQTAAAGPASGAEEPEAEAARRTPFAGQQKAVRLPQNPGPNPRILGCHLPVLSPLNVHTGQALRVTDGRGGAAGSMAATAMAWGGLRHRLCHRMLRAAGSRGRLPWPGLGGGRAAAGWSRPAPGGEVQYCAELVR